MRRDESPYWWYGDVRDDWRMIPVSDPFLLQLAGITASLLGFFVVGVFFYVQRVGNNARSDSPGGS